MTVSADDTQDLAWVRLVQQRDDRAAFARLVQRHQGRVRAVLRRLTGGHQALADELAQETFMQAYQSIAGFRGDARFQTWLYRIAYNVFLQQHRRPSERIETQRQTFSEDDLTAAGHSDSNDHAGNMERNLDLQRAMQQLSDAERLAIVYCYFADLSHSEAAEVLGWPVGTVKTQVLRAKAKLKTSLAAWCPVANKEETV